MIAYLRTIVLALVLVFLAAVLAELIPGTSTLDAYLKRNQTPFLLTLGAASVLGLLLLLGSVLSLLMEQGTPAGRGRVEGHDEFSMAELKGALSKGAALRDPIWRRRLGAVLGGTFLFVGIFGIAIVLAPVPVKLITAGAAVYAVVRMGWAFVTAGTAR